jgi:hypothetical protein
MDDAKDCFEVQKTKQFYGKGLEQLEISWILNETARLSANCNYFIQPEIDVFY